MNLIKKFSLIVWLIFVTSFLYVSTATAGGAAKDFVKVPVYDMISTNFDVMFELLSSNKFGKIILDCQSFIQGINFYSADKDGKDKVYYKFYLESGDCQSVYDNITKFLHKGTHVCIELNTFSGKYLISREYKDCN